MKRCPGFFLVIAASVWCAGAFGQSTRELKWFARKAVAQKDWHTAAQYYNKLYQRDTNNVKIVAEFAEVSRLDFDIYPAIRLYLKLSANDSKNRYPLTNYWLGQLYKHKESYPLAKNYFLKFLALKLPDADYGYYNTKARLETEACDLAPALIKKPIKIKVEHPGEPVNSKVSEYAPYESDNVLYLSATRVIDGPAGEPEADNSKVYRTEYKNGRWQKVKALDTAVNKTGFHNVGLKLDSAQQQRFFSRCRAINAADFVCSIYESRIKEKKWQPEVKLGASVNVEGYSSTMPFPARLNGREVLFFASNRPGGEGGLDIWYAFKKDSGQYENPINAGKHINTPDDEVSPWYSGKDSLLFFSTTYHKGLGGQDVFKCKWSGAEFGTPENAGFPINSSYNDVYYTGSTSNKRIYFSSNRPGTLFDAKKMCACNDIYFFSTDTVKPPATPTVPVVPPKPRDTVMVIKEELKLLVPLSLYFHNDEPNPRTKDTVTTRTYEETYRDYKQLLPAYADNYSAGLKGSAKQDAIDEVNVFFTDSLDAGFNNLKKFCDMLKKILLRGETVHITFKGYCSPLASSDYNIKLAKRRVSSLRNYFTTYENGWFNHYVNNTVPGEGKIVFEEVDVGEVGASKASDDFNDKRNSVYSPSAASERKIQILAVRFDK